MPALVFLGPSNFKTSSVISQIQIVIIHFALFLTRANSITLFVSIRSLTLFMNPTPLDTINHVFNTLAEYYGEFDWWPSDHPFEIMLGTILVQNTNWKNAQKALDSLGTDKTPQVIEEMPIEELAQKIRSSGYYNQKALKLKAMNAWFANYSYDLASVRQQPLAKLRQELLAVRGIGHETADAILVYAICKPSFVIDAYARRIFSRYGLDVPKSYEAFRKLVETAVPAETPRYAYYHGLMVDHGQAHCNPTPKCQDCPLSSTCQKIGIN